LSDLLHEGITRDSNQDHYTPCEVVERVAGMGERMRQDIQFGEAKHY
jgi:hypothetical protein